MSDWKAKRFWKSAVTVARDGGFAVDLDGRAVKTPAKAALIVPTRAMADAIAKEWDAQEDVIDPGTMPVTRSANAAIDKVAVMKDAVVEELAGYGASDLLCYRAEGPVELIAQQQAAWDPWITWAANALDAPLQTATGVMHVAQPTESTARLHAEVARLDPYTLAGLHDLVALSGSLVLALAVTKGKLSPAQAWEISRVDEAWQISQWGEDDEASAAAAVKRAAFEHAARFVELCRTA